VSALRPLSFGELFDRAVVICVRHVVPIAVVAGVPFLLWNAAFAYAGGWPDHREATEAVYVAGRSLIGVLALAIIAELVSRAALSRPTDLWACASSITERFPALLALTGATFIIQYGAHVLYRAALGARPAYEAVTFVAIGVAIPVALAICGVASGLDLSAAVRQSMRLCVRRGGRGRWLVLTAAFYALSYVLGWLDGLVQVAVRWSHQDWAFVVWYGLSVAILGVFESVVLALYAVDLRIRFDGLDVEHAMDALGPVAG